MSQKARSNKGRRSAWGTVSLVTFLAAAAYFLFTEHRAHLWIGVPLLAVCLATIVVLRRAADGTKHNKDAMRPNSRREGELQ